MRKYIAIILTLIFFIPQMGRIGVWVEYTLNKAYISQVLCINKDRPELKCDGKCYLKKQLEKVEEQETESTSNTVEKPTQWIVFWVTDRNIELPPVAPLRQHIPCPKVLDALSSAFIHEILHPPQYLSLFLK